MCVGHERPFVCGARGLSTQAQHLLRRIEQGELIGVLPQPVWQELTHKLMLAEALMLGHIKGGNPARQLANKPKIIKGLTLYKEKVRALVMLGLKFEACTHTDLVESAFQLQTRYGLLTNDSVILAVAARLGADALASADACFRSVQEVKVYSPSDL